MEIGGGLLNGTPLLGCAIGVNHAQFSRIKTASFDLRAGRVYFPCFSPFLGPTLADLATVFPGVTYSAKASELIDLSRKSDELFKRRYLKPEFSYKTKPYAHQTESLLYAIYNLRCGLLLDCGLGKTKVAIDLINYTGEKTLILVPPTLVSNWVDEFSVHSAKTLKIETLNDASAKKKREKIGKALEADVLIVGYETAARYCEDIYRNFPYSLLILDESHKVKSIKSQRTAAAITLSTKAHRRMIMSGTMALNSPTDLYSQFHVLSPVILNQKYWDFCHAYMAYATWNPNIPVGTKNLDKLNKVVRRHTLRFMKEDAIDLPERHIVLKHVEMSAEQWKMYADLSSDQDLYLDEGIVGKQHKLVALGKLTQVTGGFMYISTKDPKICNSCHNVTSCVENTIKPYTKACSVVQIAPPNNVRRFKENPKLTMIEELLEQILLEPTNKALVWAKSLEELKMIEEALTKSKIGYVRVAVDPGREIAKFNTDPEIRVAVANISVGVGWTANAANYAIYYSMSYKLEDYLQSRDRCYRIGQKRAVTEFHIVAKGTIDERVAEAIHNKQDIAEALLNSVQCMNCKNMAVCIVKAIRQYEEGCIYKRKTSVMKTKGKAYAKSNSSGG